MEGQWLLGHQYACYRIYSLSLLPTFSEGFFLRFGRGRIEKKSTVRAESEEQDVDDVQLFLGTKGPSGKGPE